MLIAESEQALRSLAAERGWSEDSPPTFEALSEAVINWYEGTRFDDVDMDSDGDMFHYEWGAGPAEDSPFAVLVTRQFIEAENPEDEGFWQLTARLEYPPTAEARAIEPHSEWCHHLDDTDALRSFIERSATAQYGRAHEASRFAIEFGPAG